MIEFTVLGPLGAHTDGSALELGGPKQKTTLAILLVNAGSVVSTDRLIDEVWGDEPPASARRTLQSFVSNLRRLLNQDEEILRGRTPGYVLDVEPQSVDARRFAAAVDRAADADPSAAADLLRDALELWRGRPFEGLTDTSQSLYAEMVRLEELRVAAVERRIEADLSLGRHHILIPELEYLTTEHPLREGLWHQLMRALHRSGRQADALRAYSKARHVLADELGIDPGRELQQLEESILLQDDAGTEPELADTVMPPGPPRAGSTVRGYELRELVRTTGYGSVFRAYQPAMGREVAVTVIDPPTSGSPDFIRSFDTAVQRIARLDHPFVPPVFDSWRDPEGAFVATRWISGTSIEATLVRGAWEWGAAADTVGRLASALSLAHRRGVVHGEVSTGSVIVDDEGNAFLAGWADALVRSLIDDAGEGPASGRRRDTRMLAEILAAAVTGRAGVDVPDGLPSTLPTGAADLLATALSTDDGFATPDDFAAALGALSTAAPDAPAVPADETVENPYKGLRAFHETDADDFFGRDALTSQLVSTLAGGRRLVAVVGPSGSGKSSVVRAGLVPALRTGAIPGSDRWFVATMIPGRYPFEELAATLRRIAVDPRPDLLELITGDETGIRRAVEQVVPTPDDELLLIVDQFEELYTVTPADAREQFITALVSAVTEPGSRLRVAITLRADFYDRPLQDPELGRLVRDGLVTVMALGSDELQQAITGPAHRVGVEVGADLAGRMIADLGDRPGALPLLQYGLTELFELRSAGQMTLESYEGIGGVGGALGIRAEDVYTRLDDAARRSARQLFLRTVTVEGSSAGTRNRAGVRALIMSEQGGAMRRALDAFGGARLLAFDADPVSGRPTVEVAHEAIFTAWTRLRGWIDEARTELGVQRRLDQAVVDWMGRDRDDDFLAAGRRLDEFETLETSDLSLTAVERDYIGASRARADVARRRAARRRTAITGVLLVATVVATVLAVFAFGQQRAAEEQRAAAEEQRAAAERESRTSFARELTAAAVANLEVDPELSILLALEGAAATEPDGVLLAEVEQALHLAVQADRLLLSLPGTGHVDFSPADPNALVTARPPGRLLIVDTSTGEMRGDRPVVSLGDIVGVAFDRQGRTVVAADPVGIASVWDVETGAGSTVSMLHGNISVVDALSSESALIVVKDNATAVIAPLDISERLPRPPPGSGRPVVARVAAAAAEPGTDILAVADSSAPEVDFVDVRALIESGQRVEARESFVHTAQVIDLAYDGSGDRLATVTTAGSVTVWDVSAGVPLRTLSTEARVVALAADGRTLATAGGDGPISVWDVESGAIRIRLPGHRGAVRGLSFNANGTRLASSGADAVARVWDLTPGGSREWVTLIAPPDPTHVEIGPNASYVAAASEASNQATLWDTATWTPIALQDTAGIAIHPEGMSFAAIEGNRIVLRTIDTGAPVLDSPIDTDAVVLAFADGGRMLIAGAPSGRLTRWAVRSGVQIPGSVTIQRRPVAIEVDATGDRFMAIHRDPTNDSIFVWQSSSAAQVGWIVRDDVTAGALGPDPSTALTGSADGAVEEWDLATSGSESRTLFTASSTVRSIAFSPDGARVATAGDDGNVQIWNPVTGELLLSWPAHQGGSTDVTFSADGRFIASTGADGTVRVYLTDVAELMELARTRVSRSLTDEECRRYLRLEACAGA